MNIKRAIIIQHPYRDNDWRVDIVEVDEETPQSETWAKAEREMLGPFKVIAISDRVSLNRKFVIEKPINDFDNLIDDLS